MNLVCPQCGACIEETAISTSADLAKCGQCSGFFRANRLVRHVDLEDVRRGLAEVGITVESTEHSDTFYIPRLGGRGVDPRVALMAVFMLIVVTTMVRNAIREDTRYLIPAGVFSGLCVVMGFAQAKAAFERQEIELTAERLIIRKIGLVGVREQSVPYGEVSGIASGPHQPKGPIAAFAFSPKMVRGRPPSPPNAVALRWQGEKVWFAEKRPEGLTNLLVDTIRANVVTRLTIMGKGKPPVDLVCPKCRAKTEESGGEGGSGLRRCDGAHHGRQGGILGVGFRLFRSPNLTARNSS